MSKVIVVFHSGYGHTKRVAEFVAEGAGGELLAIDAEGNLPEGGIFSSPSYEIAESRALACGFATSMTGPDSPPFRTPSWELRRRLAFCLSGPWHS